MIGRREFITLLGGRGRSSRDMSGLLFVAMRATDPPQHLLYLVP